MQHATSCNVTLSYIQIWDAEKRRAKARASLFPARFFLLPFSGALNVKAVALNVTATVEGQMEMSN